MQNEAITVTKILRIYARIRRDRYMLSAVEGELLKRHYAASISAQWECLQIMLGLENHWQTVEFVENLAKRNEEAA